ncbi:MAG: bifunctional isocitrate dehydrogenase kinase/phosphatase [Acidimicrobiia bacterium]|nr:bifunctional isocitrate dehydrogenase kinase/phosphatase [Acidimicrobiia bacterium]
MDHPPRDLADRSAALIRAGFSSYQQQFTALTRLAKQRFEQRDWQGLQEDATDRLDLYKLVVDGVVVDLRVLLGDRVNDKSIWAFMKARYSALIADRKDWDLAETFFNSITRRIFSTVGLDPNIEYVDTDFESPPTTPVEPVYRAYTDHRAAAELLEQVLADYPFDVPYADLQGDAAAAAAQLTAHLPEVGALRSIERIEMLRSTFYRGQRAYLVGRVYSGLAVIPLVMALANTDAGIVVDAVLLEEDDVSTLFSFTRAYFHVEAERPYDLVRFLADLTPRKRSAELYISIGYNKHGKTGLYRDLFRHLAVTDQQFVFARGTRGLVMVAFTMPGYDIVFKVIRDSFDPPKQTTRQSVMDKYQLVFRHDRAGRLVDAQEFEHLKFQRRRFTDALLAELVTEAGRSTSVEGDHVVIDHAYLERRVIPLNLYVREASDRAARAAVIDYGQTIKDLAAADIFPGDMLLKNFGVTRHGRVVFYDYDELTLLRECTFRVMPEPTTPEEEMASEPWFSVGQSDIFPEEFRSFLGLTGELRRLFEDQHAEIFEARFWASIQDRIAAGELIDILPYGPAQRLQHQN